MGNHFSDDREYTEEGYLIGAYKLAVDWAK